MKLPTTETDRNDRNNEEKKAINLHFETGISGQQCHQDGHFEDGIVLPVAAVVAFEQAASRRRPGAGEFGQIQVGKAQFLVRPTAFDFLLNALNGKT